MTWRMEAACRDADVELFFPAGTGPEALVQTARAKQVCRRCPVVERCLAFALDTGQPFGVWGGLSEQERDALQRGGRRRAAARGAGSTMAGVAT